MHTPFLLNGHLWPPFLWGSFDEGRYNKPWSGGNWDDYRKGQAERDWYNRNTSNSSPGRPPGNGNSSGGGGGGNGFGTIIVGFFALFILVPSAVSAVISCILIMLVAKLTTVSFSAVTFGKTYMSAFWATFTYGVVGVFLAFLQPWLFPLEMDWREARVTPITLLKYYYLYDWELIVSPSALLLFHSICILMAALALKVKMAPYFKGIAGYGLAIVITKFAILPALLITLNGAFAVLVHYYFQSIGQ